jgi:hypothetical protein
MKTESFFRGACLRIADLRFASGPTLFQGVKRHNAYAPVKLNLPSFSYLSKTKKKPQRFHCGS